VSRLYPTQEEDKLEIVLIDKFIVPEESKPRFLEEVRKSATFLRTLPGFMRASSAKRRTARPAKRYDHSRMEGRRGVSGAKKAAATEFQRLGSTLRK